MVRPDHCRGIPGPTEPPSDAGGVTGVSAAGLSVFRIGEDGTLTFARKYDIYVGGTTMFWMGMVQL